MSRWWKPTGSINPGVQLRKAERLDGVSPYQCVPPKFSDRATLCGAGLGLGFLSHHQPSAIGFGLPELDWISLRIV